MSEYTQGVCHDGAAILKDGQPLTIEQILEALRERDTAMERIALLREERDDLATDLDAEQHHRLAVERDRDAVNERVVVQREALNIAITSLQELYSAAGVSQVSETFQQAATLTALSALKQERDALAAYVERLVSTGTEFINVDDVEDEEDSASINSRFNDALLSAPATSLAGRDARSNCPDCEGNGNIAFVTCPICDGEGKLSSDEAARLHTERLAAQKDSCELECGAYGTYCKCAAEAQQ